jgi:hypothetical protein
VWALVGVAVGCGIVRMCVAAVVAGVGVDGVETLGICLRKQAGSPGAVCANLLRGRAAVGVRGVLRHDE